ncbi:VOC family protein [Nocardia sp. NPDC051030]|uniref:VOC family protein n=1 Tax=Nocardia sp. NPDC051030 TaxID=3155162 RepID=UPI0034402E84
MSISTFFWFDTEAEAAATQYTQVIPDSRITGITRNPDGSAFVVTLELQGHALTLMNGGPGHPPTDAASIQIVVDTQEEIDQLWAGLVEGGQPGPCGWLQDRYGISWQVAPSQIMDLMSGENPAKTAAVSTALQTMSKIDLKVLQDAHAHA